MEMYMRKCENRHFRKNVKVDETDIYGLAQNLMFCRVGLGKSRNFLQELQNGAPAGGFFTVS